MTLAEPVTEGVGATAGEQRGKRRRWAWGLAALVIAGGAGGGALWALSGDEPDVFPAADAFWEPIGDDPRLDDRSEEIVDLLAEEGAHRVALLHEFGTPVVEAAEDTPRFRLRVRNIEEGWGDNDLAHTTVPIPEDALPSSGSDGKLTIIDRSERKVYDLWQLERDGDGWSAAWGGVYDLDGDGSSRNPAYVDPADPRPYAVPWPEPVSRGTGSGIATLAGLVRTEEIVEGRIDHALVFATDIPCGPANKGEFRWPATTTDGWREDQTCIPQGARVQLDPTIDLAAIEGISEGELILGRALQTYGAYVTDKSGSRMSFGFERADPGEPDPYPAVGLDGDYAPLDDLPWESLRVLASWDGS